MNADNLRSLTTEEARAIGKKGGRASVESRRSKKAMQTAWESIRKIPIKAGELTDLEEITNIAQLQGANLTVEQVVVLAIAQKAMSGDVGAFEALARLTENQRIAEEVTAKKTALEVEKLRIEITAYRRSVEAVEVGVKIIDDIPS